MSDRKLFVAAALLLVGLSACSEDRSEPDVSDERPPSVIGDPLHRALDRAESVQGTLDDRAADLRQRLEQAEDGRGDN